MLKNTRMVFGVLALAMLLLAASPVVKASTVTTYDASLGGNGWYNGTGGTDGDFTVLTATYDTDTMNGTLQIGLRDENRGVGNIAPSIDNVYNPPAGDNVNIDWSIALTGDLTISDFNYLITLNDTTTGKSITFDPSNPAFGDAYWNGGKTLTASGSATGFQNSEFTGFSFISTPLSFSNGDQIITTFSVTPTDNSSLDPSDQTITNTMTSAPEPATFALMGIGLLGMGMLGRKKVGAGKKQ